MYTEFYFQRNIILKFDFQKLPDFYFALFFSYHELSIHGLCKIVTIFINSIVEHLFNE